MSSLVVSTPALAEPPADLVEAGIYATEAEGFEHSLVVLAMGRACWLVSSAEAHRLLVEPDAFERAREQLARYDRESMGWPPPPIAQPAAQAADVITPLIWASVVLAVFNLQVEHPGLTAVGELDGEAIFERGEWWRIGTALFLHADLGHVISNALIGILVFSAVLQTIGRRRGWLLIGAAAVAGNLAVAAINYPAPYRSLGASTAIFGAVGLLTGRTLRILARAKHPQRRRAMFVALASGILVLALYGAGGVRIDLGAHLTGFACGLALGFLAGVQPEAAPA